MFTYIQNVHFFFVDMLHAIKFKYYQFRKEKKMKVCVDKAMYVCKWNENDVMFVKE